MVITPIKWPVLSNATETTGRTTTSTLVDPTAAVGGLATGGAAAMRATGLAVLEVRDSMPVAVIPVVSVKRELAMTLLDKTVLTGCPTES